MVIYCDMDGVLAKWDTRDKPEDTHKPGYFLAREEERKISDLLHILKKMGYEVSILSAVYTNGYAVKEKEAWLDQHGLADIPRVFIPYGGDKSDYVAKTKNILIDDYSKNLHQWEKSGYVGIKYMNGINGSKGTWKGHTIDHRMTPQAMAQVVAGIAEGGERV